MSEVYALGRAGAQTQATVKMSMGRKIVQYMQIKNFADEKYTRWAKGRHLDAVRSEDEYVQKNALLS
jgi:hypothetical protein